MVPAQGGADAELTFWLCKQGPVLEPYVWQLHTSGACRVGVLADMGATRNSSETLAHLRQSDPQLVWLIGDATYAGELRVPVWPVAKALLLQAEPTSSEYLDQAIGGLVMPLGATQGSPASAFNSLGRGLQTTTMLTASRPCLGLCMTPISPVGADGSAWCPASFLESLCWCVCKHSCLAGA